MRETHHETNLPISVLNRTAIYSSGKDANTQSLTFVKQYCVSCHDEETETSLNVEALSENLTQAESFGSWVKIFDRIAAGEMPPQDAEQPNPERVEHLLKSLRKQL